MKLFSIVPLLLTIGCAHAPRGTVTVKSPEPPSYPASHKTRVPEVVRAYHLGRYVDPNNLLHAEHPIFRVEASSHWNLKPGPISEIALNPPLAAASAPPSTNDVILAELSRQRDATERVMWEASQLAASYDQLQKTLTDMAEVAKNHAWMRARLFNAEKRLAELELKRTTEIPATPTLGTVPFGPSVPPEP
jgi:hypothetical protein